MLFYKRSCDLPKSMTLTLFKFFLCFLGITGVDGQAFRFSQIALSRPTSAVGATLQANCNATYLASTPFVMDWRINNTVVGLYQITNNKVPQLADGSHQYDVVFSIVNETINTGDEFEVNLEIRNLTMNDNQTAISVTCTNCVQVSTLIHVEECQQNTSNGVIASDVVSPCGLGCQVQYSCEIGYKGPIINATCLADATFDATPSCVQNQSGLAVWIIILIVLLVFFSFGLGAIILCWFIEGLRALSCCAFDLCGKKFGEKDKENSAKKDATRNNEESKMDVKGPDVGNVQQDVGVQETSQATSSVQHLDSTQN